MSRQTLQMTKAGRAAVVVVCLLLGACLALAVTGHSSLILFATAVGMVEGWRLIPVKKAAQEQGRSWWREKAL